jgi:hypothetical protein
VHENCGANTDAKIPDRTGDANHGVEANHPRPAQAWRDGILNDNPAAKVPLLKVPAQDADDVPLP